MLVLQPCLKALPQRMPRATTSPRAAAARARSHLSPFSFQAGVSSRGPLMAKDRSPRCASTCTVSSRTDDLSELLGTAAEYSAPAASLLGNIGNTPLLQVGESNTFVKLEGHNPSGSIKDRALSSMVECMLEEGKLHPKDDTLCLVTSGSAGVTLQAIHKAMVSKDAYALDALIVMPAAYAKKAVPTEIIETEGVEVHYSLGTMLASQASAGGASGTLRVLLLEGAFVDVLAETKGFAKELGWQVLDQHHDSNGMKAHEATATELMAQLPGVTDVVCTTGTGATAAGLRAFLPSHVRVHARPGESGAIDGLSDVGRYNNFCDTSKLDSYYGCTFSKDSATKHQQVLCDYGVHAGPSSGAALWLATELNQQPQNEERSIAFIAADGRLVPEAVLDLAPLEHGRVARLMSKPEDSSRVCSSTVCCRAGGAGLG